MKHVKIFLMMAFSICTTGLTAQPSISGLELLNKSIEFHDPGSLWQKFNATLELRQTSPDGSMRVDRIYINRNSGKFSNIRTLDGKQIYFEIKKGNCMASIDGSTDFTAEIEKKYHLDCASIQRMRDYYLYLYGLPMKLKDEGTNIDPVVEKVDFQGKTVLQLKVTYREDVGKDVWYFYIDPNNYSLQGYRFYHDEEKNDGEYITLKGLETVNSIKIPKIRKWYFNSDDKFLGTDELISGEWTD